VPSLFSQLPANIFGRAARKGNVCSEGLFLSIGCHPCIRTLYCMAKPCIHFGICSARGRVMCTQSHGIHPIKERPILSSPSTLAVPLSAAPYCPPLHDLLGHNEVDRVIVLREILVGLAPVNSTVAVSATPNQQWCFLSILHGQPRSGKSFLINREGSTYRHNHATTFNRSGGCHFFLNTFTWVDLGIKWWYVRGQLRPQISHSSFRVARHPPLPGSS